MTSSRLSWFVAAVVGVCLLPATAAAATWVPQSQASTYRLGYTLTPSGSAWQDPKALKTFVGSSFDATFPASVWAATDESDANGKNEFVSTLVSSQKATTPFPLSIPSGEDFCYLLSYAHVKDPQVSRLTLGQYASVGVGGVTYTQSSKMKANVRVWDAAYASPIYAFSSEYLNPDRYVFRGEDGYSPSAERTKYRGFAMVAGKWDAGTSKWRVRVRIAEDDGSHYSRLSDEATFTPSASALALTSRVYMAPSGYHYKNSTSSAGTPTVDVDTASYTASNLEAYQSALTTDSTAVAAVWDRMPSQGTLEAIPDAASNPNADGMPEDDSSLPWPLNTFFSKIRGWIGQLGDVFWPLDILKELTPDA